MVLFQIVVWWLAGKYANKKGLGGKQRKGLIENMVAWNGWDGSFFLLFWELYGHLGKLNTFGLKGHLQSSSFIIGLSVKLIDCKGANEYLHDWE